MWPGLWMLPGPGGTSGDNFEIDQFEGSFLDGGANALEETPGICIPREGLAVAAQMSTSISAPTITSYGLNWVPGQSISGISMAGRSGK